MVSGCGEKDFELGASSEAVPRKTSKWASYGGEGGMKFSDLKLITKENVAQLEVAWVHRSRDIADVYQLSPILVDGQLVGCSPRNKIFSLDPLTGGELWRFDPEIDQERSYGNVINCRGLAAWHADNSRNSLCSARIFTATNDARLIAVDSRTGQKCSDFGQDGEVDLSAGVGRLEWSGEYQVTSPPAVIGDLVVVGSAVSDGRRTDAPSGVVRAFHARTGALSWAFDLAPPGFDYHQSPVSDTGYALGTPNVWSAMSVDAERDMIFLPTGNPSPDYYRDAQHSKLSYYGSSIVALRGSTGEVIWNYNTVYNDFWDFDVPSQPVVADMMIDGSKTPLIIQSTKMGFVFVLNRETGEPVVEVQAREVPRFGPLADQLSPVQPFPPQAFRLSREYEAGSALFDLCDELDSVSQIGPVYTPLTEEWTIGLPSNMGATNWGGVAVDPVHGLIAARTSSVPFRTKLIARAKAKDLLDVMEDTTQSVEARRAARSKLFERFDLPEGTEVAPQRGTDYLMARHVYLDPTLKSPCSGIPFGELMVIDVANQTQLWRRSHGTTHDVAPLSLSLNWGVPGVGGPMITATGLVIVAGIEERAIRAYDIDTGEELWHHRLPLPGNANPISYSVDTREGEKQFVVIAAGGDARAGSGATGDYLIAFGLPD